MSSKTDNEGALKNNLSKEDEFLKWFRLNYSELKTHSDFKNYCKAYIKLLSIEERKTDLLIENMRYKKIIENFEDSSKKFKLLIADQFICTKKAIDASILACRVKNRNKMKSIKDAFGVLLTDLNKKIGDLQKSEVKLSPGYFETELSLILEDKWLTDYLTEFRKSLLLSLNQSFLKYIDSKTLSEINDIIKEKARESQTMESSNKQSSNFQGVFKKPENKPIKTKKSVSNLKMVNNDQNNSADVITNKCEKNLTFENGFSSDKFFASPSSDIKISSNKIVSEENLLISNIIKNENSINPQSRKSVPRSKSSTTICDSKISNLSNIMEVSEPSNSNEGSVESAKSCEVLSKGDEQYHELKTNFIENNVQKSDFITNKEIAESTKIPEINKPGKCLIENTVEINDFLRNKPIAESTKKFSNNYMDNNKKIEDYMKNKSTSESMKVEPLIERKLKSGNINQEKSVIESKPMTGNTKILEKSVEEIKETKELLIPRTIAENTKPVLNQIVTLKSEIGPIELDDLAKLKPIAESTKKTQVNILKKLSAQDISKENHIEEVNYHDNLIKQDLVGKIQKINQLDIEKLIIEKEFLKNEPFVKSTKKDSENFTENTIKFDDFLKNKPMAESTKKVTENLKDITTKLEDFLKNKPIAESTKKTEMVPKSNQLDPELTIIQTDLLKSKPMAESTKIGGKLIEDIKDFESILKYRQIEKSEKQVSNENVKLKNELNQMELGDLAKLKPIAESTKKPQENLLKNLNISNIIDIDCQDQIFMKKDFVSRKLFEEDNEIMDKNTKLPINILEKSINVDDFFKNFPVAESTKKISTENRAKIDFVKIEKIDNDDKRTENKIFNVNKRTQIPKLLKSPQPRKNIKSDVDLKLENPKDIDNDMKVLQLNQKLQNAVVTEVMDGSMKKKSGKENCASSDIQMDNNKCQNNLIENELESVKKYFLTLQEQPENNFDKTKFDITQNEVLELGNASIFEISPWSENLLSTWWKEIFSELSKKPDVLLVSQSARSYQKINFKMGNVIEEYYINSKFKLKCDNFVEIYLARKQFSKTNDYVVKILNSTICIEYYVMKYISGLYKEKPTKIDWSASICQAHSLQITPSHSFILMPFYKKGTLLNLSSLMRKESICLHHIELLAAYVAIELICTIHYLHNRAKILHCDIKPDNVVINENFPYLKKFFQLTKTQVIAFIDFGKAIFLERFKPHSCFITRGSPKGLECVEMVSNRPWRYQIDLFNIATTLYVLLQNQYPKIIEKNGRFMFSSFHNFRNLRGGNIWLSLFDVLINIESTTYPNIQIFMKSLTEFIQSHVDDYNVAAKNINKLLDQRG